jgi:hypothetical protein
VSFRAQANMPRPLVDLADLGFDLKSAITNDPVTRNVSVKGFALPLQFGRLGHPAVLR